MQVSMFWTILATLIQRIWISAELTRFSSRLQKPDTTFSKYFNYQEIATLQLFLTSSFIYLKMFTIPCLNHTYVNKELWLETFNIRMFFQRHLILLIYIVSMSSIKLWHATKIEPFLYHWCFRKDFSLFAKRCLVWRLL